MALRHLARRVGVPSLLRAAAPRFSPAAGARHLSFRSFQERIRRMLDVFKKERSNCRGYRSSEGYNPNNHQYSQRYRDAEANQRTNFRSKPRETMSYAMSRHYSILGLDRSRSEPYSDAEIKVAFRRKAMQYHPDHNQNNKEVAEAKFKEVMDSYEAIKSERRNRSC